MSQIIQTFEINHVHRFDSKYEEGATSEESMSKVVKRLTEYFKYISDYKEITETLLWNICTNASFLLKKSNKLRTQKKFRKPNLELQPIRNSITHSKFSPKMLRNIKRILDVIKSGNFAKQMDTFSKCTRTSKLKIQNLIGCLQDLQNFIISELRNNEKEEKLQNKLGEFKNDENLFSKNCNISPQYFQNVDNKDNDSSPMSTVYSSPTENKEFNHHSPECKMLLDKYGRILYCTKNSGTIFGIKSDQLKNKMFRNLMSFHDRRYFQQISELSNIVGSDSDICIDPMFSFKLHNGQSQSKKSKYCWTIRFLMPHSFFDKLEEVKAITCKITIKKSNKFDKPSFKSENLDTKDIIVITARESKTSRKLKAMYQSHYDKLIFEPQLLSYLEEGLCHNFSI